MSNRKRSSSSFLTATLLAVALPLLGGCAGAVVGGAATVGVAAFEERGIEGNARDLKTAAQVREKWLSFDHTLIGLISLEVYNGRALLTGAVTDEKIRADAVRLAWAATGVEDVINEIQVVEDTSFVDTANDAWISAQLRSKIAFDKSVFAINYSIETVNGIVYLIGTAQSQVELDRVIAHAREVSHVRRVVSHVQVKQAS
jgi:osmotically-inducible protein OsmY